MECENYEDYVNKFGIDSNWDEAKKMAILIGIYEGLVLVYRNLIDIRMIDELMRSYIVNFWEKISQIIPEIRRDNPLIAEWTEYLYTEVMKVESKPAYLLYQ